MGAHCSRDYTGGVSFRIRTMQKFSIIIPVYNGGVAWWCCLEALLRLDPAPYEIIAVDDGSTDGSQNVPTTRGVRALKTPAPRSGPAVARNLGAMQAHGEILWFVDSDVVVQADALSRLDDAFRDPELAAVFGSYDDAPGASKILKPTPPVFGRAAAPFAQMSLNALAAFAIRMRALRSKILNWAIVCGA
jgi:glycosyltransferase involved in cell wall biosynthesis